MTELYYRFTNDLAHCFKTFVKLPTEFTDAEMYIATDFNSACMYAVAYFSNVNDLDYYKKFIDDIIKNPAREIHSKMILPASKFAIGRHIKITNGKELTIESKYYTDDTKEETNTFILSPRIFIYAEHSLNSDHLRELIGYGENMNPPRKIKFLSESYVDEVKLYQNPIAFISHDSRDKDKIARVLADNLIKSRIPVWYDEYSLKVGDSLTDSINNGIKNCKKCILILSKNFLSNSGWGRSEFRSAFTKDMIRKERNLIPIWVDVTPDEVLDYHADLADTFAINWRIGVDKVCRKIEEIL